jgi:periplasmic protein TonB
MKQELQTPEPQAQRNPSPRVARQPVPMRERKPTPISQMEDDDDGFFAKHRMKLIVLAVLAVGAGLYFVPKPGPSAPPPRKAERIVSITVPPPPPPQKPPPPPQKVEPPKEKMEKETQLREAKVEPKPQPKADPPPTALATGIKGDGPGMAGLSGSGNGVGGGTGTGAGAGTGGTGSKFGWYAGQVQKKIASALSANPKTKTSSIDKLEVRIWPDASGRITRASLTKSTGSSEVDDAIERQVLTGLQLDEPPPAGMKLPIVLRITATPQTQTARR